MENPRAENPFELTPYNGIYIPRILLNPDRAEDLAEYSKGWEDQRKNPVDQIIPKKVEGKIRTDIRAAENWYDTGAAKCWTSMTEPNSDGHADTQQELDEVMSKMRVNPDLIPHDAWPNDDEDNKDEPKLD